MAGATGSLSAPSAGSAAKSKTRCPFASIGAAETVSASVASGRRSVASVGGEGELEDNAREIGARRVWREERVGKRRRLRVGRGVEEGKSGVGIGGDFGRFADREEFCEDENLAFDDVFGEEPRGEERETPRDDDRVARKDWEPRARIDGDEKSFAQPSSNGRDGDSDEGGDGGGRRALTLLARGA